MSRKHLWLEVSKVMETLRAGQIPNQLTELFDLVNQYETAVEDELEFYEKALSGSKMGAWEWSPAGEHIRFDLRCCSMLGLEASRGDHNWTQWQSRIHPHDLQRVLEEKYRLVNGEISSSECIYRLKHQNGEWIWILDRAQRDLHTSPGQAQKLIGTFFDMTAWKENEIEKSTVVESMSVGLVVHDQTGAMIRFNPAALEILNLTEDQILGRTSMDPSWVTIQEDGSPFPGDRHPAMEALRTGKPVHNKMMGLRLPSGDEKWIQINAMPFESSSGRKVAVTFSDVSTQVSNDRDIKQIFRSTPDLICVLTKSGNFKRFNPSFFKILGWSELDLYRFQMIDLIHPEDTHLFTSQESTGAKILKVFDCEVRMKTKDGSFMWINWVCEQNKDDSCLYMIGRDVTRHKATEIRNREILNAIEQSASVCYTNPDGTIMGVNENFCSVSGYSRHEVVGNNHRMFNSKTHSAGFFKNLWDTIASGRVWIGDIENRKKNGDFYSVRTLIAPLKTYDGKIERYISILFDVTDQKKVASLLAEAQQIAKIGSWQYNFSTNEQWWSSEHYRIFEIPENQPKELLFQLYTSRIHPDDLPVLHRIIERARIHGEDFVFNHRVILDDGKRTKHVQGIGKVVKEKNGKPLYISGTCQDLSTLVQREEQHKFTLDSMGIGVWRFDPVGQNLIWDDSMYKLFDVDPKEFSGHYQAWESTLSPEAKEHAISELTKALSGEKEFNTTFEIMTKSQTKKQIGGRGVVVRDLNGQPTMMYGINWDRTDEVLLNRNLQAERLKSIHSSKLASLGEMSAGVAHEINNPLAIIVASLPLLSKFKDDPEKMQKKIASISAAAKRIEKIVNGLRKFSRSSEPGERILTSLVDVIQESLIITELKSKRYFTPIQIEIKSRPRIMCDSVEIEQVIVNLVNNAIDAAKDQTNRWVRIEVDEDETVAILRVIDSGPGISPLIEEKLFDPFFTTKPVGEGTGLGLSISKGIIESHKGTIALNRQFPTTCFELRFLKPQKIQNTG